MQCLTIGDRYEVKEVAGGFLALVWPPGTPHATPGLQVVLHASSAEDERILKTGLTAL
jgi:hypothetical protein